MKETNLILAVAQSGSIPGDVSANVARHLRFGVVAAEHGVQFLVFPELSLTGYEPALARSNSVHPHDPKLDPLRRLAEEARMTVVVGAPILNDKRELHIGALAICSDGMVSTYTKQHLHPGEDEVFTPGLGGPMLSVEGAAVALAICADTTYPQHPASAAACGANVYAAGVLITENGYASDTALLRQYSLQHKMAVLMANHSAPTGGWVSAGKSAIWSDDGELVATSPGTEEGLLIATRHKRIWDGMSLSVPTVSSAIGSQTGSR
ncbi:carbon-nitrogen hydrolase family protein [Granulicella arctica]|uniref:Putative amidohydrolase n=1 Tax=Granulicella arctica TaxID=940613 RepID=A0A7Y9TR23_9BACT|nr:carbon-nitrogen hydrolase family protein [Granulicella arctica]NYF77818.1 putative amidohydrolase [Granulicella arctica]